MSTTLPPPPPGDSLTEARSTALAVAQPTAVATMDTGAGVHALGRLTDAEFDTQLQTLKNGLARLDKIIEGVLEEGTDILTLPGAKKIRVLALPGAEKLAFMARLVATYRVTRTAGNGENEPRIMYEAHCDLHLGSAEGPVVASAVGTCNSSEPKYRWRQAEAECPSCHHTGTIRRSKYEAKPNLAWAGKKGWYCHSKAGGCGVEYAPDDPAITLQNLGRIENPEPYELDNTLCKMAQKRGYTSAIKTATGGSARFTVDAEENPAAHGFRDGGEAEVVGEGEGEGQQSNVDRRGAGAAPQSKPSKQTRSQNIATISALAKKLALDVPAVTAKASALVGREVKSASDLSDEEMEKLLVAMKAEVPA